MGSLTCAQHFIWVRAVHTNGGLGLGLGGGIEKEKFLVLLRQRMEPKVFGLGVRLLQGMFDVVMQNISDQNCITAGFIQVYSLKNP